jgi:hypothetical protein
MTVTAASTIEPTAVATVTNTTIVTDGVGLAGVIIEPDWTRPAAPNQVLLYTHTVTNTGTFTDSYTLNVASSQAWTVSVAPPTLLNVPPAATRPVTVTVNVPAGAATGTIDMTTVTVASQTVVTVTDTAVDTTMVTGTPLTLSLVIAPDNASSGPPGAIIAYAHTLTNTGTVTDTYSLTAVSDQGWAVTGLPAFPVTLAPGESAAINLSVAIPAAAANGVQDFTTVTATSLTDNSVTDQALDTTTVFVSVPTLYLPLVMKPTASPPPPPPPPPPGTPTPTPTIPPFVTPTPIPCTATGVDLIVTQIQVVPNPPVAGQPASVFVTIRNQGSQDVAFGNNFYLDFYVDRVPSPLVIGDRYAGIQGADMTAGSSHTYLMDLSHPDIPNPTYTFTSGSHQLYAQVDTDNTVDECPLENNNILGPVVISVAGLGQDGQAEATPERPDSSGPRLTPTPESLFQQQAATPMATPTLTPMPVDRP